MDILIDGLPFTQQGLDFLQVKLQPLSTQEIIRSEDGTLLYAPDDGRMEIVLEGKGQIHPCLSDIQKGAKFTLSHPLPLWTNAPIPPRAFRGSLQFDQQKTGYLPIFHCILSHFELKTELVEISVSFKFVFEEV